MSTRASSWYNGKLYRWYQISFWFKIFGKKYSYWHCFTLEPRMIKWLPKAESWDVDWCEDLFPDKERWFNRKSYSFEWLFWAFVIGKEKKYE